MSDTTATDEKTLTNGEMLDQVTAAIYAILVGGQSYKIGSRQLTRADLGTLKELWEELSSLENEDDSSLIDNTYAAYFDGR